MNRNPKEIICRYCKCTGHYKNKCPKLVAKNNNQNHQRLIVKSNTTKNPTLKTETEAEAEAEPKAETKIDEFPSLGNISKTVNEPVWGGKKSFADILTSQPPEEKQESRKNDICEMVLLG